MGGKSLALIALCILSGCDDGSGTFALHDGCYRTADSGIPVLWIRGEEGTLMAAGGDIRSIRVRPRVNEEGAYLEARPAFRLERPGFRGVRDGTGTAAFPIEPRDGGQAILAPLTDGGRIELRLGPVCDPTLNNHP